jgi:DNA-binding MarR family transcriptional regulator
VKSESVLLSLQRATHATLHHLAAELVDLDLTASEINALGNLADGVPRTVSELGAAVGSRPTTLTGILDRLERRDLIARDPHPTDRRAVVITLTDTGRTKADVIASALAAIERHALAGVPAAAIAGFRTVVAALIDEARP